jgi:hypothetical protein
MKKIKSYFIISISVSALSFPLQGLAFQASKSDANGQVFSLTLSEGTISATIDHVPMGEVLKRFSDVAEVDITVSEARAKEIVSVDFTNLTLQKGIQRILGENYTLIYGSFDFQKLTDIRIVNNFSMSNTVAGKTWIRFSPEIDLAKTKQNREELEKLVFLGKLPNDSGNVDSEVLINLALNDANTQVRKLAFLALAKQAGTETVKSVLLKSLENYSNQEVQSFAHSLLKQLDDDNLVMASAVNKSLPLYSSISSNTPAQSKVSEDQAAVSKNSDAASLNQDSKNISAPETVVEKNDNDQQQANNPEKNNQEKNEIEPNQQQKDEEKGSEANKDNETQPENEAEKNKEEKSDPQQTFKQKLDEADPQDILPILTEGIRQGLEVDVATLDQFASDDYPVELRQTAIEEIVDRLGYQDGYDYLKQKIAAEPEPEMVEFIKAIGVQFINEAKWITKKTFDRTPFQ